MTKKRIIYSTDGEGNYWRTIFADQCDEKMLFGGKCQGVKGHEGACWRYRDNGSYEYDNNHLKDLKPEDVACGSIPPEHKSYINPVDMQKHYYMSHRVREKIIDADLIARLEKDELEENESLTRPCSLEE